LGLQRRVILLLGTPIRRPDWSSNLKGRGYWYFVPTPDSHDSSFPKTNVMKQLYLFIIFSFFISSFSYSQSTLITDSLFSNALDQYDYYQIYLPEGYDAEKAEGYQTIYFLHGSLNDHTSYGFIIPILDSLIANGLMEPTIVVKPNGSHGPYGGSMYTNSALNGHVEDWIIQDLIPHIDAKYNTRNNKQFRTIMGHSMGADGASRLALTYPELFRAYAGHSGAPDINLFDVSLDWIIYNAFAEAFPPYEYQPIGWSIFFFIASSGWSPNLENEPYQVDLPVDEYGFPVDSILQVWSQFTAAQIVAKNPEVEELDIYFDCGIQDQFQFFPINESFKDTLDKYEIPHTFLYYDGLHGDQLSERFPISLQFLDSVMNAGLTDVSEVALLKKQIQFFPNPSTGPLTVQVELTGRTRLSMNVLDLKGQKVKNLMPVSTFAKGTHQWTFQMRNLPPATYIVQMNLNGKAIGKKWTKY
jgi:S-formylglutathione hydrolase FrmB